MLTTEQKENSENMFKVFEAYMVQKPNKWVDALSVFHFNRVRKKNNRPILD